MKSWSQTSNRPGSHRLKTIHERAISSHVHLHVTQTDYPHHPRSLSTLQLHVHLPHVTTPLISTLHTVHLHVTKTTYDLQCTTDDLAPLISTLPLQRHVHLHDMTKISTHVHLHVTTDYLHHTRSVSTLQLQHHLHLHDMTKISTHTSIFTLRQTDYLHHTRSVSTLHYSATFIFMI